MKKIILIALSAIFLISCNSSSYKVVGEIKGLPEGTKVSDRYQNCRYSKN
jgi:hypothetical protein